MANNNDNKVLNVPHLRFPEFTGEWEKLKLDAFTERVMRKNKNNLSKLPLTISAQYGLVDQITFFNKVVASTDMSNYYLLKKGEFAYNKSYSSDYPWGAIKRLDNYEQGALSSLYICFAPQDNVESDFILQYFESPKWHKGVSEIAVEGARNHGLLNISVQDFFHTYHYIPKDKKEQTKIAKLLMLLDKRIATQNKIIEDLKKLKFAISKKVFSNLSGNRVVKLGSICRISTGKLDANAMTDDGQYMFFTCSRDNYKTNTYAFEGEALLIAGNGDIGSVKYYDGRFNAYQRTYVLQHFTENIKYSQFYIENHLPQRVSKEKNVGTMPYIVLNTLTDMPVHLPQKEVQNNITQLLEYIDNNLKKENYISNLYNLQKQYLLHQMFI